MAKRKQQVQRVKPKKNTEAPKAITTEAFKKWADNKPEVTEDVQGHTNLCPKCEPKETLRALWVDPDRAYHVMCVKCGLMGPAASSGSLAMRYWDQMPRSGIANYEEMRMLAMNILHRELERYNELSESEELDEEGIQTVARMAEAAAVLGDVWE